MISTRLIPPILAATALLAPVARAACDLKITSVYPVNSKGKPYHPKFGETYYLKVEWNVTGTPKAPYSILFKLAGETYKWTGLSAGPGSGFSGFTGFNLELDGGIPFSVTLDPDKTSGDSKTSNNVLKGTLTPTPPAKALEYFNPIIRTGSETCTVPWNQGGTVSSGYILMGKPVSGSFQKVVSTTGPAGNITTNSTPHGDPVWQTFRYAYTPSAGSSQWSDTSGFKVSVSGARVNIAKLRAVTWADEAAVSPSIAAYTQPNDWVQSTDPAITAFVNSVLPSNYRTTMKPYDAAKKLYMAVVKRTAYETPAIQDAKTTLSLKKGDCGSFTNLCSACFRSIGIPSRSNSGFWIGNNQWHVNGEFYLQGVGWIPFDGSESKLFDPSGVYPYFFGSDSTLNQFCAVSRGEDHRIGADRTTTTQVGQMFYSGTATFGAIENSANLK